MIGVAERAVELDCRAQRASPRKRASIIASRQRRAESRCVRANARPERPVRKAIVKAENKGDTRQLWTLTTSF